MATVAHAPIIEAVAIAGYGKFTETVLRHFTATDAIMIKDGIIVIDPWEETSEEQKNMWRELAETMIGEYLSEIHG
jgi:hypothetical protein